MKTICICCGHPAGSTADCPTCEDTRLAWPTCAHCKRQRDRLYPFNAGHPLHPRACFTCVEVFLKRLDDEAVRKANA